MECIKCKRSLQECDKDVVDTSNTICTKCKSCLKCRKKAKYCKTCMNKCISCKKIIHINDFPNSYYENKMCYKCDNACISCDRYTSNFVLYKNIKYCMKCFLDKYDKTTKNDIYELILDDKVFKKWLHKKTKKECIICNNKFMSSPKIKIHKCNKCKNKKIKNPSNDNKKYILKNEKWIESENRVICKICNNSFWINIINLNNKSIYRCKTCKPKNSKYKYKYNKKKQKWIKVREIKIK